LKKRPGNDIFTQVTERQFVNGTSPNERRIKMEIKQLTDNSEKQNVTRLILEALPDWFGIPEAREGYIKESADKIFFCAYDRDRPIGFLYLKETGNDTVELYVMGVLMEFHRNGIGRNLKYSPHYGMNGIHAKYIL